VRTTSEYADWEAERCGVYCSDGRLAWCGSYQDAAVLDQVLLCWLTDTAHTAAWHLAQLEDATDRDDLSDRFACVITPFFTERGKCP
jgi:hypothetical protein